MPDPEVLLKCNHPGCDYVTSEMYNYCPKCGLVLYLYVDGEWGRSAINRLGPEGAACPMAPDCDSLSLYVPDCDRQDPTWRCFAAMHDRVESILVEIRLVRKALEDAGLQGLQKPRPDPHKA